MTTYILIPGAGGVASYWSLVVPLLEAAGETAIAVDLPGDDPAAALPEYADLVRSAMTGGHDLWRDDVVLVAMSLGGFTVPLVATTAPVSRIVFVNAMIPVPGETAGAWWANTEADTARVLAAEEGGYSSEFDLDTYFLHDVPPEVVAAGEDQEREEVDAAFGSVCDFDAWPDLPTHVVAGADDRFFPIAFQRRVARERLGRDVDPLPGGHLIALSHPDELAGYLLTRCGAVPRRAS